MLLSPITVAEEMTSKARFRFQERPNLIGPIHIVFICETGFYTNQALEAMMSSDLSLHWTRLQLPPTVPVVCTKPSS
jgi:hypothetical protein